MEDKSPPANTYKTGLQVDGGDRLTAVLTQCSSKAEVNQHTTLTDFISDTALTRTVESLHT